MADEAAKLFIVQNRDYPIFALQDAYYGAGHTTWEEMVNRYPPEVELVRQAFARRADAEEFKADLERSARDSLNLRPLYSHRCSGLERLLRLTEFDRPVFLDWLTDHDIPPPPEGEWIDSEVWESWLRQLSRHQAGFLLAGLHRLEFYELFILDLVVGSYLPEQWEEWEKDHTPRPPEQPRPPVRADQPLLPWGDDDFPF